MSDLGNKKVISENIQHYMRINNKTRNEMCSALGVKYTTLTDWIKGNTYPRIDKIELMANYFGIEKSDLIEDKSGKTVNKEDKALLDKFHSLTATNQQTILSMIDVLLSQQASEKESNALVG